MENINIVSISTMPHIRQLFRRSQISSLANLTDILYTESLHLKSNQYLFWVEALLTCFVSEVGETLVHTN